MSWGHTDAIAAAGRRTVSTLALPPVSRHTREIVAAVREASLKAEQLAIPTEHLLHGGMYARTVRLVPKTREMADQIVFTSVCIKIPTVLILNGPGAILTDDGWARVSGFNVIAGSAGRQSVFVTHGHPVEATMLFPTRARTVDEAEREFTDEVDLLFSRKSANDVVCVTGE